MAQRTAVQRGLALAALLVVLVAIGWVAVPFKDGAHACNPALLSAVSYGRKRIPAYDGGGIAGIAPTKAYTKTWCKTPARNRAATSGVVVGLALVAWLAGERLLRPADR